jgi:uncharacterized protein (TIGR03437 family)
VLFAALYLAASALHRYGANKPALIALGTALLGPKWHNIAECGAAAVCVATGLLFPRRWVKSLLRAEQAVARFAGRRTQAILFVGALPLLVRAALLPVLGIPDPLVADEFGYLLLADTFASGRVVNATHPFWQHFETVYVFHQPTYSSIYPVAPAILLAAAKVLGMHPWIGVWFGAGLMCALICWMLQGWLPPKWAFLGGLLAVCRFAIVSSWMNTYWGGAAAAIGGALVLGALPRIMKHQRRRDSLLFALGLAILSQSRPFEGVLFAAPLLGILAYWLFKEKRVAFPVRLTRVALPIAVAMTAMVAGTLWYNARATGNPLLPPYLLHQRIYGTPQTLFWQAPVRDAPGVHRYQDIADVFQWQLAAHQAGFSWANEAVRLGGLWQFYLQPLLTLPLLLLPLVLRRRRMLMLVLSAVALLAGNAMYPFFFPHYAAPICGLTILLILHGMRYLRILRWRSRPVGAVVLAGLLLSIAASGAATVAGGLLQPWHVSATYTARGQVLKQLHASGGKHLVLVRYSPHHEFHYGVVFNDADIDRSAVIWAHQRDAAGNKALANYFSDRDVWLFNPDESPVTLVPFTERPYISALAAAAGRRDDTRDGVSPGSIAILLGGNFARDLHGATNARPLRRLPLRLLSASANDGDVFAPCESESDSESGDAAQFPLTAADLSVEFGASRAPILAVSHLEGQEAVTIQVPFDVPVGEALVTLRAHDLIATRKVTILPATPGIFQMRMADAAIRGIVLRADGTVIDLQHPAHPGETLRMFATGLGPMLPEVRTNQVGSATSASQPVQRLIIGVNHRGVPLVSARYAEGMVGIEEITFRVPGDVPAGRDIPLSVGVVVDGRTVYSNKSSLPVQ